MRMTKRLLLVYPFAMFFALLGATFITNTNASAAVSGENGPIVYVENQDQDIVSFEAPALVPEPVGNQVITTSPDGSNTQAVATEEDPITAVGISPPTDENTYNIAYATNTTDSNFCDLDEASCAPINTVGVTADGSLVQDKALLTTIHSQIDPDGESASDTWVSNISFSPDASTVLATAYTTNTYEDLASSLIAINAKTGEQTVLVGPRRDPCLNGGYADNGYIYYSRINNTAEGITYCYDLNLVEDETNYQSDIWVIKPGEAPARLTNTSSTSEFFIDVSPDNRYVLVVDTNSYRETTCYYAYDFVYRYGSFPADGCRYYYVDTTNGDIIELTDMPEGFTPSFFSPDNTSIIGTYFPFVLGRAAAFVVDTSVPYTALVNRTTFEMFALTNQLGVSQWSPSISSETPDTPTTPVTTTQLSSAKTVTLANTGINSSSVLLIAAVMFVFGGALIVAQRK